MLLMEGANSAAVPTTILPPSQRILATMTLLLHYLRQPAAKLPSSITLFITQMVDTSLDYRGQRHCTEVSPELTTLAIYWRQLGM